MVTVTGVEPNRAQSRDAEKRVRRNRKVYVIKLADPDMVDVVIRARSVSLERYLELVRFAAVADTDVQTVDGVDDEVVEAIVGLCNGFAEALVSWNLDDDDGDPIPATAEAVMGEDADFILPVIMSWLEAIGSVAAPLGPGSSNGGASLEAGIPMQPVTSPNP